MEYPCMICGTTIPDYDPKMCCSGRECGCMGQPTEPAICSDECWDKFGENNEMNTIIHNHSWIKVKRFIEPKEMHDPKAIIDWKFAYQSLNDHHTKETEFLINKCRELAQIILDKNSKK